MGQRPAVELTITELNLDSLDIPMSHHLDYWDDPSLSAQIDAGIERNRKSDAVVRVTDAAGQPLAGVPITVEQVDSSFHFGANIFMLDSYPTPEENRRYEEAFCGLFNAATVPFYWRDLEPEQGKPRFAADSPFIARRPPPDRAVAFCEEHGLKIHGHTLVWNFVRWSIPEWLPDDPAKNAPLWEQRIRQIAKRYGNRIHRWDAVNEVVPDRKYPDVRGVPPDYERLAFTWADRYFPKDTRLDINELTDVWDGILPSFVSLVRRLLDDGARVGGMGLQFHLWSDDELRAVLAGKTKSPAALLAALDTFAQFKLPIHVSEITLPSPGNDEPGQAIQAHTARSLYRLWFSHPAVDSITWWNVPDGGAAPGEDALLSGLLTRDLKPKASYHALRDLIHREWRTRAEGLTSVDGTFSLRGFHGKYQVTAGRGDTQVQTEGSIDRDSTNEFPVILRIKDA